MATFTRIPQQKISEQRARVRTFPQRGGDSSDEGSRISAKRARKTPSPTIPEQKLLACPYSKFDFARYSEANLDEKEYRRCSSHFLTDVPRLKQHLYRVHCRPKYHCRRCFEVFPSEVSLNSHARRSTRCQQRECPFSEKLTDTQVDALRRKWPGKTPSECFYIVYKILFPDAPVPDSPYADQHSSSPVQKLLISDMADSLSQIVIERLSRHQSATTGEAWLSEEAKQMISQTIKDSIHELQQRSTTGPSLSSRDREPVRSQTIIPQEDSHAKHDEVRPIVPLCTTSHGPNHHDRIDPDESLPDFLGDQFNLDYLEPSALDLSWGPSVEIEQASDGPSLQLSASVQQHYDHLFPTNMLYSSVDEEIVGEPHLLKEHDRTAAQVARCERSPFGLQKTVVPGPEKSATGAQVRRRTSNLSSKPKLALPTRTRLPKPSQQRLHAQTSYRDTSTPSDSGYSSTRTQSRASSRSSGARSSLAVRVDAIELCEAERTTFFNNKTPSTDDDRGVWRLPDIHEEGFSEAIELLTSDWNDWHPTSHFE